MKILAELIGLENVIKIMETFAGLQITVPKNWKKVVMINFIKENAHKMSAKELAKKTGFSLGHIRYLVRVEANKHNRKNNN
jgi:Mor family transcriptional regulator